MERGASLMSEQRKRFYRLTIAELELILAVRNLHDLYIGLDDESYNNIKHECNYIVDWALNDGDKRPKEVIIKLLEQFKNNLKTIEEKGI
jgi:hypothetical protein